MKQLRDNAMWNAIRAADFDMLDLPRPDEIVEMRF
jgi:hypothetical protein